MSAAASTRPLFMDARDPICWKWMPELLARVRRFSSQYGTDDPDGAVLCSQLVKNFTADVARDDRGFITLPFVLGVLSLEDGRPTGHLVLSIDSDGVRRWATVVQMEMDRTVPRAIRRQVSEVVERWARERGCEGIQAFAISPERVRAYSIFYSLRFTHTILRRPIAALGGGGATEPTCEVEEPSPDSDTTRTGAANSLSPPGFQTALGSETREPNRP